MKKFNSFKDIPKWDKTKTNYQPTRSRFVDRTGQKIGRLTLEYPVKPKKIIHWVCLCDCGNRTMVAIASLLNGSTKSCGCIRKEIVIAKNRLTWKGYGELTGHYIGQIKYQAKKRDIFYDVSTKYLWELFLLQKRKCALSGFTLTFGDKRKKRENQTASLDRIDSDKGYIEGNVQWVHKVINIMKGRQGSKDFVKLCATIAEYNNEK